MRDLESKKIVHLLELCLTRAEAQELCDGLATLLADNSNRHEHLAGADSRSELTVWIDDRLEAHRN